MARFSFFIAAALTLSSCATTPQRNSSVPSQRPNSKPGGVPAIPQAAAVARTPESNAVSGMPLAEAQAKALTLQPGMPQETVRELLGSPNETAARTYGSATPKPWTGFEWQYKWTQPIKRLEIVFSQGSSGWFVNNWEWKNY